MLRFIVDNFPDQVLVLDQMDTLESMVTPEEEARILSDDFDDREGFGAPRSARRRSPS